MANKKFSEFELKTTTSSISHIVGYSGAENCRISPANFVTTGGTGVFLPLAGGTMTGALVVDSTATINDILTAGLGLAITGGTVGSGKLVLASTNKVHLSGGSAGLVLQNTSGTNSLTIDTNSTFTGDLLINTTGGYFEVDTAENRVKFADNTKATFGTGQDLQIYHSGATSLIEDLGTGDLNITSNGSGINLQKGQTAYLARFFTDGASELYFNGSKKFETTNTGVVATGTVTAGSYFLGDDSSISLATTGAGNVFLRPNGQSTSGQMQLASTGNATFAGSVTLPDTVQFKGTTYSSSFLSFWNDTTLSASDDIIFAATGGVEKMRLTSTGLGIGTSSASQKLHVSGNMRLTGGFRDRSNSQGAANYVLTSTGSNGTEWVDASNSSIIGGPYLPTAGGTITGVTTFNDHTQYGDQVKAKFGASGDLEIYHDGSNSYIQDTSGTGELRIDTNLFRLRSANGGETMIRSFEDGAVILSHNNVDRLTTTSTGVAVTNTGDAIVQVAGDGISNSGGQLKGFNNGFGFTVAPAGGGTYVEAMRLDGAGNLGIGTSAPTSTLHVDGNSGATAEFRGATQSTVNFKAGSVNNYLVATTTGTLSFRPNGSTSTTMLANGYVGIGLTNPGRILDVQASGGDQGIGLVQSGTDIRIFQAIQTGTGDGAILLTKADGSDLSTIRGQGDSSLNGGDLKLGTASAGLVLKSANGTQYKITVADNGTVTSTAV